MAVLNNRVKQFPHQDIQTNSCIHFDIKHNISDYGHVAITCIMTGTNPEKSETFRRQINPSKHSQVFDRTTLL